MLARLLFIFCLIVSLVYCQNCNVNNCAFNSATDHRGNSSVDVSFPGSNFRYSPSCIIINKGATINYNGPFSQHPLVAGTYSSSTGKQPSSNSSIPNTATGSTLSVKFDNEGVFPFYCDIHFASGMVGVIYVGNQCSAPQSPSSDAGVHFVSFIAALIAGLVALLF